MGVAVDGLGGAGIRAVRRIGAGVGHLRRDKGRGKGERRVTDLVRRRRVAAVDGGFLVARLTAGDTGRSDAGGDLGKVGGRHGVWVELGWRGGGW